MNELHAVMLNPQESTFNQEMKKLDKEFDIYPGAVAIMINYNAQKNLVRAAAGACVAPIKYSHEFRDKKFLYLSIPKEVTTKWKFKELKELRDAGIIFGPVKFIKIEGGRTAVLINMHHVRKIEPSIGWYFYFVMYHFSICRYEFEAPNIIQAYRILRKYGLSVREAWWAAHTFRLNKRGDVWSLTIVYGNNHICWFPQTARYSRNFLLNYVTRASVESKSIDTPGLFSLEDNLNIYKGRQDNITYKYSLDIESAYSIEQIAEWAEEFAQ